MEERREGGKERGRKGGKEWGVGGGTRIWKWHSFQLLQLLGRSNGHDQGHGLLHRCHRVKGVPTVPQQALRETPEAVLTFLVTDDTGPGTLCHPANPTAAVFISVHAAQWYRPGGQGPSLESVCTTLRSARSYMLRMRENSFRSLKGDREAAR